MGMIWEYVFVLVLGSVIVEHVLEGLHRNYWTVKIKELILLKIQQKMGEKGALYEYLLCKFCESWAMGWVVALITILWRGSWSWDWLWMGVVMSSGANAVHGLKGWLEVAKFAPFNSRSVTMKKGNE